MTTNAIKINTVALLDALKRSSLKVAGYSSLTHSVSCSEVCPFCMRFLFLSLDLHNSLEQPFCAIQEPTRNAEMSKRGKVLHYAKTSSQIN
jgi:hypothetical protein